MITVKTQDILNSFNSLIKIDELSGLSVKSAKQLRKAISLCKNVTTEHYDLVKKFAKEFADLDESGNPLVSENNFVFADEIKKKAFSDKVEELINEEEKLSIEKIPMSLFDSAVIPQVHFLVCDWLFLED
jgi:hypothetical protein